MRMPQAEDANLELARGRLSNDRSLSIGRWIIPPVLASGTKVGGDCYSFTLIFCFLQPKWCRAPPHALSWQERKPKSTPTPSESCGERGARTPPRAIHRLILVHSAAHSLWQSLPWRQLRFWQVQPGRLEFLAGRSGRRAALSRLTRLDYLFKYNSTTAYGIIQWVMSRSNLFRR